ncbi:MAG: HEAT repeat domain-containing protein [Legionellaceae bacterium]|nr:HEAT repeat domain-containing protein [Legionellaceae bacterium]
MKIIIILITTLIFGPLWANKPFSKLTDIVDVYGVNHETAHSIKQRYASRVRTVEMQLMVEFMNSTVGIHHPKRFQHLLEQKNKLIQDIKENGHFSFVDLQTVNYPGKQTIYTTIEIIPKNRPERLRLIPNKSPHPVESKQHDVIDDMITYQNKAIQLLITNQLDLTDRTCPVYHCIVPFTHPTLKPYLTLFNVGVSQKKKDIIHALNHDQNPERRAAAAFLIGHFADPHDIVALLSSHVTDPDDGVRNNVLRVIGETISKANLTDINTLPFLKLLDSPFVTDRNKALIVLLTAADSESGKQQITLNGRQRLLTLLQLKQPNNHDIAYSILKKISGQDFGPTNIQGWEEWTNKTYLGKKPLIT